MRGSAAFLAALIAACASDTEGECAALPPGSYEIVLAERGGDCGDIPPIVDVVEEGEDGTSLPDGCTGYRRASADQCDINIDQTCETRDASGAKTGDVEMRGAIHRDSRTVDFTIEIAFADGSTCTSTYTGAVNAL